MKRLISLIIAAVMIVSMMPLASLAENTSAKDATEYPVGTTKENPYVFSDADRSFVFEAEDYPFPSSNYKVVSDSAASGGKAIIVDKYLLKDTYKYKVPGNLVHYRLWVKAEVPTTIRLLGRARHTTGSAALYATSAFEDKTDDRSAYLENGVGVYSWCTMDSFELPAGEIVPINILFYSARTFFDKFIITDDLLYTPQGIEGAYKEFVLGEDTTDYSNLRYPLPPFTPRKERPRILINSESLVDIRKNLDHPENKDVYAQVLKNAEATPSSWSLSSSSKYVWANAFLWQLNGDKEAGQKAVDAIMNSFAQESGVASNRSTKGAMNDRPYQMLVLAIVYDWCYDFLTPEQKMDFIGHMLYYSAQQEYPYPPNVSLRNNGHESEGDIFTGQFSCAISIYEDYPEMYNVVGGKIFEQAISTRNHYYEMKNHNQGTHYNTTRMLHEFYLFALLDSGVTSGVRVDGVDECILDSVFSMRPDSQLAIKGDDNQNGANRQAFGGQAGTFFFWGNYTKNPYVKDAYYRYHPNRSFSYSLTTINHVMWLIYNDPSVGRKSYLEYPNVIYLGDKSGLMHCRTSWEMGDEDYSDQMYVRLNMETFHSRGHDHLDTGHFDIYYKGSLALDSGHYASFGDIHHKNYAQRGIAHNIMLLYDPEEVMENNGYLVANDGGQDYKYPNGGSLEKFKTVGNIATIVGADYGDDMKNPSFAYMKGDLTKAYWEGKMENYTRSFVYLNFFDETYPGALIVFDRMVSKKPELKKTWLLHTQQEPSINIETGVSIADKTEEGDNGRIINQTLYPKKDNLIIEKVGGPGYEYYVDGVNYQNADGSTIHPDEHKDYGEWRLEISPKERTATDCLLNVIHVTEANDEIVPLEAELIEAGNFLGAKIKDRVAFFNTNEGRTSETTTFTLTGDEEYEILFTDVSSGQWIIYKDGKEYDRKIATENGGDFSFKGTKGEYTIKKNKRSALTFTRDMDYKNYLTPVEDYDYFEVNGLYYDFEYLKEGDKLFVNAEKIALIANSCATIDGDILTLKGHTRDFQFAKDSDEIRVKDGIWYIDADSLQSTISLSFKNPVPHMYTVTGGISDTQIEFYTADDIATVVSVTVPEEDYDGSAPPEYAADVESGTRWQTNVIGSSITFEFDAPYEINSADIYWTKAGRAHFITVETSQDGQNWTTVFDGTTQTVLSTSEPMHENYTPSLAKYVRITNGGNTEGSGWIGFYKITFPSGYVYYGSDVEENTEDTEDTEDTEEVTSGNEPGLFVENEDEDEDDE